MPQVPIRPISWPSRDAFVRDVHAAAQRQGLNSVSAALLTAHIALSTGWGRAADNYRLAGIKAVSETQDYTVVEGFEYVGGVRQPSVPMKWRSFNTLDEGVAAILQLLQAARYASSLSLLLAGSTGYFRQLGLDGWYTAPPADVERDALARYVYIRGVVGLGGGGSGFAFGLMLVAVGWWIWRRFS